MPKVLPIFFIFLMSPSNLVLIFSTELILVSGIFSRLNFIGKTGKSFAVSYARPGHNFVKFLVSKFCTILDVLTSSFKSDVRRKFFEITVSMRYNHLWSVKRKNLTKSDHGNQKSQAYRVNFILTRNRKYD